MALYRYDKDTPRVSKCTASVCVGVWPPVEVKGAVSCGKGLSDSMFSTITRPDGTHQLTVDGAPLYTYSGDTAPGKTSGQGLGDFYVVGTNGQMIGHS